MVGTLGALAAAAVCARPDAASALVKGSAPPKAGGPKRQRSSCSSIDECQALGDTKAETLFAEIDPASIQRTSAGDRFVDLEVGQGKLAGEGSVAQIRYRVLRLGKRARDGLSGEASPIFSLGYGEDDDAVGDSVDVVIGAGNVVLALDAGIRGMRAGGRRRINVRPERGWKLPDSSCLTTFTDVTIVPTTKVRATRAPSHPRRAVWPCGAFSIRAPSSPWRLPPASCPQVQENDACFNSNGVPTPSKCAPRAAARLRAGAPSAAAWGDEPLTGLTAPLRSAPTRLPLPRAARTATPTVGACSAGTTRRSSSTASSSRCASGGGESARRRRRDLFEASPCEVSGTAILAAVSGVGARSGGGSGGQSCRAQRGRRRPVLHVVVKIIESLSRQVAGPRPYRLLSCS